jgi:serine/threonine protein kinase
MRLVRHSTGVQIEVEASSMLGAGGEARVYAVRQERGLVAKIYHHPTPERARKLEAMLANPPDDPMRSQGHASIAWPVDLLCQPGDRAHVVGYLMPRVSGMSSVIDFYNPKARLRNCPVFHYLYLHRTARNLASAFGALHARGYVVGDVNESNILAKDTALVTLVDTDSFQVRDTAGRLHRCTVGKPEYTPPELQGKTFSQVDRSAEHDLFGLGVVIFQLLMEGTHPFAGVYRGVGDAPAIEDRIKAGHFPHGRFRVPYGSVPLAPPFEVLHPKLQRLAARCFEDGHRDPSARPHAHEWTSALSAAEAALVTCRANDQHRYGSHLPACPWCERATNMGGFDTFPPSVQVRQRSAPAAQLQQAALPAAGASPTRAATAARMAPASVQSPAPVTSPNSYTPTVATPPSAGPLLLRGVLNAVRVSGISFVLALVLYPVVGVFSCFVRFGRYSTANPNYDVAERDSYAWSAWTAEAVTLSFTIAVLGLIAGGYFVGKSLIGALLGPSGARSRAPEGILLTVVLLVALIVMSLTLVSVWSGEVPIESRNARGSPAPARNSSILLEEFNGKTSGSAVGIRFEPTPTGQGAVFSRETESRVEYSLERGFPVEGTLEWRIRVVRGYDRARGSSSQESALIFTTTGPDTWYPGSTWLRAANDGSVAFEMADSKGGQTPLRVLKATGTTFRFGDWHTIGISFGSQGRYIRVDGDTVAQDSLVLPLAVGGNLTRQVDVPTIGEFRSRFPLPNNRFEQGFEGVVDTFRASTRQQDWELSK